MILKRMTWFQNKIKKGLEEVKRETRFIYREAKDLAKNPNLIKRRLKHNHTFRNFILGIISIIFIIGGGSFLWFASLDIPDLSSFDKQILGQSTKIYDRTGKILLYDMGQNVRRTILPLNEISKNIQHATIAIEDSDFYEHKGIKPKAIIRAVLVNIFSLELSQGGSTITQQVIKNTLLTKEKKISRKLKEWVLAIKLEKKLSKDEILELYLNQTPYGGTVYGVEEAAQQFFGKSAREVDIAEAAYIAAIPQAPSYYSPYGSHREELETRKNLVLLKMKELGHITNEEYEKAKSERVTFDAPFAGGIKAPHFVMYIREYIEETYGEKILRDGGLKVTTTLDYELQKKAEEIVKKYSLENAKLYHATNSGLVAIDAKTGQILVMVGSRDYFDKEIEGNFNVTVAKRQPGSSFKPFAYALAFNKGYRPETLLFDAKTQFSASCPPDSIKDTGGCYSPDNYDGKFRGPISMRNALAQSINIPAVQSLYLVGVQNTIDLATKMGISTLTDPDRYGLSLVLGGGEVTLLDMTGAYSVFATGGEKHATSGILKVEDKAGNALEEWEDKTSTVLPKDTTLLISSVLSDDAARSPIFGTHGSLYFSGREVAAKTGTTNFYRDTWVIGYTPQVSVGAWAGNNDNSPIDRKVAGYIVAPMWHAFMDELLKTLPNEPFEKPAPKDLSSLKPILRGSLEGENGIHSILYYVDKENPLGPTPSNPYTDPQFERWEFALQNWINTGGSIPLSNSGTNNLISIAVLSPQEGSLININQKVNIVPQILSDKPIKKVDYFLNGSFLGSSLFNPYSFSFIPKEISSVSKNNTVRIVATDSDGSTKETTVSFKADGF